MIPVKLHLKNFLSYADTQIVNFAPYHLICLSGKNGHGKSALLDALTWSLWGQARKLSGSSRADQGLVRLGQRHMMVSLDFILNNQLYRVKRELEISRGKVSITLDFGIIKSDQSPLVLTEKTTKATQQKIEKTICLDFDGFVNSAFLRQGQSNEFSKKSPKERKDILATILGLNNYDDLKKLALEKIRTAQNQCTVDTILIDQLTTQIDKKKEIEECIAHVEAKITECIQSTEQLIKQQDTLKQEQCALAHEQGKYESLQGQIQQLYNQQHEYQDKLRNEYQTWKLVNKNTRNTSNYIQLLEQKKQVLSQLHAHQNGIQQSLALQAELVQLKHEQQALINTRREHNQAALQQKINTHERLLLQHEQFLKDQQRLLSALDNTQTHHALLTKQVELLETHSSLKQQLITEQTSVAKSFEKRKATYQEFSALGTIFTTELRNIEQKNQLVGTENDPSCPLCEQNLSASRRRFLRNKLHTNEQFIRHRLHRLSIFVQKLKPLIIQQNNYLTTLQQKINNCIAQEAECIQIRNKAAELELTIIQTHKEVQHLQSLLDHCNHEITNARTQIDIQEQAALTELAAVNKTFIEKINSIEAHIALLNNEHALYHQTQKAVAHIEQTIIEQERIYGLAQEQKKRALTIDSWCTLLKKIKNELQKQTENIAYYDALPTRQTELTNTMNLVATQQHTLLTQQAALLEQRGKYESEMAKIITAQTELITHKQRLVAAQEKANNYQVIAHALGKDGIQALLIEEAIPEIEQEANKLLSKLTDNQAHLFIESLRDLKKGGVRETLDIKISDSMGIRPYEMFSGGEAFRIDFALRIAISKLLARRAGTTLQTLIIDEGFGSQDEEGLTYIMDAIHTLQNDFAKVIIVSHLDSMKEQFPVHFLIEKSGMGSIVTIVENH